MSLPGRRRFLLGLGAAGLGALGFGARFDATLAPAALAAPAVAAGIELPETLHVLSVPEYFTLAAACERIFPRDGTPGALDLGAPSYIDRALSQRPLPAWADGFRAALARFDAYAVRRFGVAYCKARSVDQDVVLSDWEAAVEPENAAFLRNLVTATLEGALGDPSYGGNAQGAGWIETGFPVDPFTPTRMT